jgi:hypothetical protein
LKRLIKSPDLASYPISVPQITIVARFERGGIGRLVVVFDPPPGARGRMEVDGSREVN